MLPARSQAGARYHIPFQPVKDPHLLDTPTKAQISRHHAPRSTASPRRRLLPLLPSSLVQSTAVARDASFSSCSPAPRLVSRGCRYHCVAARLDKASGVDHSAQGYLGEDEGRKEGFYLHPTRALHTKPAARQSALEASLTDHPAPRPSSRTQSKRLAMGHRGVVVGVEPVRRCHDPDTTASSVRAPSDVSRGPFRRAQCLFWAGISSRCRVSTPAPPV